MKLQELAQHTIDIEYPGMSLEQAFNAAQLRAFDRVNEMREIEAKIQSLSYALDQVTNDYHEVSRAANLFQNAIDEIEGAE